MIGIYKITFSNGHYYFGQAVDINRRFSQHKRELNRGNHSNSRLQNCFNKYGEPIYEVIEECSKEELSNIENKYLYKHIDNEMCCNICRIGKSSRGVERSQEFKDKISAYQYLSGKNKPVYMFSRDHMHLLGKFRSIGEAEKAINCYPKDIQKSCKSNGKYNVKGYKFMYAAPIDNFLNHLKDIVKL
jgi:hypothetical protein